MKSIILRIKNKIKTKKGVITYWPAKEFVSSINLKKYIILVVMRMMKKDVKYARYLLDGTAYLVHVVDIN